MEDDLNIFGKWKTTSHFLQMEDDLNFVQNGRQPKFVTKRKTTSILRIMEDNLNFKNNGRRPQF